VLQDISYLVDVYRGQLKTESDLVDFALYLAYFPKLIAGPIERARTFLPKLAQPRIVDNQVLARSITLIFVGVIPAVPCTCSIIVKHKVAEKVKGFVENCPGISNFYEDQAFYAKICLEAPVVAINTCWDKYRQRSSSEGEDFKRIRSQEHLARTSFLNWLDDYITQRGVEDINIRLAIRKELWLQQIPAWSPNLERIRARIRWIKKWLLRLEEMILPVSLQYRMWITD
jgi:hypothetical protein